METVKLLSWTRNERGKNAQLCLQDFALILILEYLMVEASIDI